MIYHSASCLHFGVRESRGIGVDIHTKYEGFLRLYKPEKPTVVLNLGNLERQNPAPSALASS
jgi:hypothetical protein